LSTPRPMKVIAKRTFRTMGELLRVTGGQPNMD
jgi:hypothetical protein